MAIPSSDRTEYAVSSLGAETSPQSIIVKSSLWTLQISFNRFVIKEFEGYLSNIDIIVNKYRLTQALKVDKTFDPDKFWIWVVDFDNNLSLYEFEPFTTAPPVLTYSKLNIFSGVLDLDVYIRENDHVRIVVVESEHDLLTSICYENIKQDSPAIIGELSWSSTRLNEIGSFVYDDRRQLDVVFVDVLSPPNIYLDSYDVDIPANFTAAQVGDTNVIYISWDASASADSYLLQKDTDPSFTTATEYTVTDLFYSDVNTLPDTYYYRVRALNTPLLLQSYWSSTESVTLPLVAEFSGVPTYLLMGNSVQFTDESVPSAVITEWHWNFGDGTPESTEQNPLHVYNIAGLFTVTLQIYAGTETTSITKPNYIEVATPVIADFVGSPTAGDANLIVQFTDLSTGGPIAWDWDFGDGTPHSTQQNPIHVYAIAGDFTVTLTVTDGVNIDSEVKTDYISVDMVADFIVYNGTGYANLIVQFSDTTLGVPTSWDWDFGDGGPHSTQQNPTHTYTLPGHYTVTLIASNAEKSDTIIKTDIITVYTHAAFEGSPLTGYQFLTTQFVDESTGEPTSWYWDFGDGGFSDEQNPQHTYISPGEYTVSLSVASFFNSDVETKVAYVIVSGTATPDIAPEPDILLYIDGQANAYRNPTGIRIVYNKKE